MVAAVNRNLAQGTSVSQLKDSRRKDTSPRELLKFYAIQMAMENTYGNSTSDIQKHFAALKCQYGRSFPNMGIDRFLALLSAFAPSVEELDQIAGLF